MGKTIIITGGSDGIGAAAARQLAANGEQVVIVGRSAEKTRAVAKQTGADYFVADFADLAQVRSLADELNARYQRIDVLANNAGGIFSGGGKTVDGFEMTFQVNYLASFVLTNALLPKLINSSASVIQTASIAARLMGKLTLDDLQHERDFSTNLAYGTTKLANILFTFELHRRYNSAGLAAAAFHPGVVASSFATNTKGLFGWFYRRRLAKLLLTSPQKGADQLIWLAQGEPGRDWDSGTYYEKRHPPQHPNPQVADIELASQLWNTTEELLGMGQGT